MENSLEPHKNSESMSSMVPSQRFPSPPKQKKDFYLDTGTFVTEGDEKVAESGSGPHIMSGFPNANYINETYWEINGVLDTLNNRIKGVVDSNQDVFISAYRDSMIKMNDELKGLEHKCQLIK